MLKRVFLGIVAFLFFHIGQSQETDSTGYTEFRYDNGIISSEGYFKNGNPNGYWKTYYPNGNLKSKGNRKNFKLDSLWRFYREDGALEQEINYTDGKRNGYTYNYNEEGLLVSKIPYDDDVKQGWATFYFPERRNKQYEKKFVDGKVEGEAYEYSKDRRVIAILKYEKGFLQDRFEINRYNPKKKKTGLWITYHDDIEETKKVKQLEGRYVNGLKNGYFREYDRNGELLSTTKYVNGEVVKNAEELMNVEVKQTFHDNAQVEWERTYLNGKPHGVWKKFNDSGQVISGKIYDKGNLLGEGIIDDEGLKQGPWKEYYQTGELRAEGEYLDGARYKKWKFYFKDGSIEQHGAYLAGGKPHGMWKWYYEDGDILREEYFRNGKEDGEILEYDEDGNVVVKGYYINGLEDGEWTIISGKYKEVGKFIEGMRYGEWKHYYLDTEELAFEGSFIDGLPDGKHTYYYDNGKKMLQGKYQAGLKEGVWKRFNRDGILILTNEYEGGQNVRINGRKIKQ
jgi:YD repeat-containing protein